MKQGIFEIGKSIKPIFIETQFPMSFLSDVFSYNNVIYIVASSLWTFGVSRRIYKGRTVNFQTYLNLIERQTTVRYNSQLKKKLVMIKLVLFYLIYLYVHCTYKSL